MPQSTKNELYSQELYDDHASIYTEPGSELVTDCLGLSWWHTCHFHPSDIAAYTDHVGQKDLWLTVEIRTPGQVVSLGVTLAGLGQSSCRWCIGLWCVGYWHLSQAKHLLLSICQHAIYTVVCAVMRRLCFDLGKLCGMYSPNVWHSMYVATAATILWLSISWVILGMYSLQGFCSCSCSGEVVGMHSSPLMRDPQGYVMCSIEVFDAKPVHYWLLIKTEHSVNSNWKKMGIILQNEKLLLVSGLPNYVSLFGEVPVLATYPRMFVVKSSH